MEKENEKLRAELLQQLFDADEAVKSRLTKAGREVFTIESIISN